MDSHEEKVFRAVREVSRDTYSPDTGCPVCEAPLLLYRVFFHFGGAVQLISISEG